MSFAARLDRRPGRHQPGGTPMKYMLLIYSDPANGPQDETEGQKLFEAYGSFTQDIVDSGEFVAGAPLAGIETATTVQVRNDKVATNDGPFAETKEVLGG